MVLWKPCRLERDRSLRPGRGASSDSGQGLFLPGENRRRRRGARALAGSMAARPLGAIRRQAVSSLSSLFGSLRPEGDVRWATLTLTAIIGGRGTLDGRLVPSECLGRKTYGRYASGSTKRVGSAIRALFDLAIDSKLRRCGLVRSHRRSGHRRCDQRAGARDSAKDLAPRPSKMRWSAPRRPSVRSAPSRPWRRYDRQGWNADIRRSCPFIGESRPYSVVFPSKCSWALWASSHVRWTVPSRCSGGP